MSTLENYGVDELNTRRVKKLKRRVARRKHSPDFKKVRANEERNRSLRNFATEESAWLEDYAFFRALMEENGGRETWDEWPTEHSLTRFGARLVATATLRETTNRFRNADEFLSLRAMDRARTMARVKAYAEEHGVALMGDIPFGVSYYSADVFRAGMNSRSIGRGARRRNRISKTTSSPKNGDRTGAFRFIAGT